MILAHQRLLEFVSKLEEVDTLELQVRAYIRLAHFANNDGYLNALEWIEKASETAQKNW